MRFAFFKCVCFSAQISKSSFRFGRDCSVQEPTRLTQCKETSDSARTLHTSLSPMRFEFRGKLRRWKIRRCPRAASFEGSASRCEIEAVESEGPQHQDGQRGPRHVHVAAAQSQPRDKVPRTVPRSSGATIARTNWDRTDSIIATSVNFPSGQRVFHRLGLTLVGLAHSKVGSLICRRSWLGVSMFLTNGQCPTGSA